MSLTSLVLAVAILGDTNTASAATSPETAGEAKLSFVRDVVPVMTKAGCNMGSCHGSFQGRGGMKLSLLGFDPEKDYHTLFREMFGRRVSAVSPDESLLLLKATGNVPHGGGKRIEPGSSTYNLLRDFIDQGLTPPGEAEPQVVRLIVSPEELVLDPAEKSQLHVQAVWSDGYEADVTHHALYESRHKMACEVNGEGEIAALEPGRTSISVKYMGQVAAVPVTIPYGDIEKFPKTPKVNYIDELAEDEWKKIGLTPAGLCSDNEFVRRAYIDLIGTLPKPDEVRVFVADKSKDKRARLIETLLERPEYVDFWSLRYGDLLRVHRRYVGEKGLGTFWNWLRGTIRENRPLDQMVTELLTSRGNLYSSGPVAYYFVDTKPEELAETTSQVFLGVRMQCTRCHHHPNEVWSQEDYYGLASFFTRLEIKDNGDNGRYGGSKLLRPVEQPSKKRSLVMDVEPRLFGVDVKLEGRADVRVALAEAITSKDNPYFARNFANRYWAWLTGRGLVEPVDDFRATNPPTHPELLDALAADFVEHGYDVRHLIRTICASRVYQLASVVAPEHDREGIFLTHRVPKRLSAEVLLDAVNQVAGSSESFEGVPGGTRAIGLPDPTIPSYFLNVFGRPLRNSPCECARSSLPDLSQALHLANGLELHAKICDGKSRAAQLSKKSDDIRAIVKELYLAALAREPSAEEWTEIQALLAESPSRREGLEDLVWTLLNSSEFVFNH